MVDHNASRYCTGVNLTRMSPNGRITHRSDLPLNFLMKPNTASTVITVVSLAILSTVGCAREKTVQVITSAESARNTEPLAAAITPEVATAQWTDIKDLTYDLRGQFFTGLTHLNARVDLQVNELTAQRAAMTSAANPNDWDFAMKEMINARAYLLASGKEMNTATSESWNQQKEKVGLAWTRTQEAYAKVKSSVTN